MASGSQLMTTYYAKRIVGDASAAQADKALLQTGANVVADTWILNRTNRATTYGIKYVYDGTNGHDKVELYGGSATASAWVQLDTGDITAHKFIGALEGNADSATQVKVTNTTPTSDTSYYLTYTASTTTGNQDLRNSPRLYWYDNSSSGKTSYLCIGSSDHSGGITVRNANGKYADIVTQAFGASRTLTLPDETGTFALLTKADINELINLLDSGTTVLTGDDYIITQHVGGGTTTKTYYRRMAKYVRVGGLTTAREIYVALGNARNTASKVTFDGTADKAIHVSGTLAIANGGTGKTTAAEAWTALGGGASGKHADNYFALASHGTHVTTATVKSALGTVTTTAKKFLKDTGDWVQVAWGDLSGVPSTFAPSSHSHTSIAHHSSSLAKGSKPSSTTYLLGSWGYETGSGTAVKNRFFGFEGNVNTSGRSIMSLIAYQNTADSTAANSFSVWMDQDGTRGYSVTDAAAFRSAIGAGTSSLVIGTTATTAAAGNHNHDSVYAKLSGAIFTGNIAVAKASGTVYSYVRRTDTGLECELHINSGSTNHGVYSNGYYSGSAFTSDGKWLIYRNSAGTVTVNGNCTGSSGSCTGHAASDLALTGGTMTGQLYINYNQDVNVGQNGSLVIGPKGGENIGIDGNEIMARNNSATSTLYINSEGGNVYIGSGGITSTGIVKITNTTASSSLTTGALVVSGGIAASGDSYFKQIYFPAYGGTYGTSGSAALWYNGSNTTQSGESASRLRCNQAFQATKVYNGVWNDYAECRKAETLEPGRCVYETENGVMKLTKERLQAGCRLTSDTYGTCMGETENAKTPIAVAGRVLAYPFRGRGAFHLGDAVCSAPGGTIDVMTREEIRENPERIVGTVSEIPNYEIWQAGTKDNPERISVNGRIWIYVR